MTRAATLRAAAVEALAAYKILPLLSLLLLHTRLPWGPAAMAARLRPTVEILRFQSLRLLRPAAVMRGLRLEEDRLVLPAGRALAGPQRSQEVRALPGREITAGVALARLQIAAVAAVGLALLVEMPVLIARLAGRAAVGLQLLCPETQAALMHAAAGEARLKGRAVRPVQQGVLLRVPAPLRAAAVLVLQILGPAPAGLLVQRAAWPVVRGGL